MVKSKQSLTPEEQNARMGQERKFLANLLESALNGQGTRVLELADQYSREHHLSLDEVLSQFKDAQKRTALHFACLSSPASSSRTADHDATDDIVQVLLSAKNVQNACALAALRDQDGMTPLMLAAKHSNPTIAEARVKIILNIGGTKLAWSRSNSGATALHYAAGAGATPATIHCLADATQGSSLATTTTMTSCVGGTPLHWAAALRGDFTATLLALLNCKADMDMEGLNEHGLTALLLAVAAGNDLHGKCLVQAGASPVVGLPGNVTIYHMAADLNLVGTLALLFEMYPEMSQEFLLKRNASGETPLDLAVQEGHLGCVMLIKGENDVDVAKAFMEEHKRTLGPRAEESATKPLDEVAAVAQEDAVELAAKQRASDILQQLDSIPAAAVAASLEFKTKGNQHFVKKEWAAANDFYSQAIDADPTNETFYSNRSASYLQLSQTDQALSDAVVCAILKPGWSKAHYRLAVARMEVGRFEDAALAAWEGLQLDQQNDELKRLLQKCVKKGRKEHLDHARSKGAAVENEKQ